MLQEPLERGTDLINYMYTIESTNNTRTHAPYPYLLSAIQHFQQRNLRNDDDAINAMTGILQRVAQKANTTMSQGLPLAVFPLALIFFPIGSALQRRRSKFASWSWAGWAGRVSFTAYGDLYLFEMEHFIGNALDMILAHIWSHDFMNDATKVTRRLWVPEEEVIEAPWLSLPLFSEQAGPAMEEVECLANALPYELLSITAISIHAYLQQSTRVYGQDVAGAWALHGKDDHECGFIHLDTEADLDLDKMQTFLILGVAKTNANNVDYPCTRFGFQREDIPLSLWIVLITQVKQGLWERRGIGQLLHECLYHTSDIEPRWTRILLA